MKSVEIIGFKRANLGKQESKALREEANVPCVMYGGNEQVHFHVPMYLFRDLVYTPEAHIVKLNVEGSEYECVLQDIQFHPVNEMILHADFLQLHPDKPVKIDVPVHFTGNAPGVQQGGKLVVKLKKAKVRALPAQLPDAVVVDISGLGLGKTVKVKDIITDGFEILNSNTLPVASVEIPRGLRGKMGAGND